LAEEAQYMYAYSLYMDAPIYNLDQTSSREAIQAMQFFINQHPESEYLNDGTAVISELQEKLEKKAYERAKQYNKIGVYKSALVAFDNFRLDFPSSVYNEELGFLKIQTQYNLAKLSTPSLQEERFRDTIKYYHEFAEKFSDSSYSSSAKSIYDDSVSRLNKIVKNN
jgi:outer membrane protein assembly factor BamD